jgi:hypothetical protein
LLAAIAVVEILAGLGLKEFSQRVVRASIRKILPANSTRDRIIAVHP